MAESEFFPYHPRRIRAGFALGAALCAVLTAWAAAQAHASQHLVAYARTGVSAGLSLAFFFAFARLRRRPQWGVEVSALTLRISRPFSRGSIELAWSQISQARRNSKPETLVVFLHSGKRILVARHLFSSGQDFERMAAAIRAKIAEPKLDA